MLIKLIPIHPIWFFTFVCVYYLQKGTRGREERQNWKVSTPALLLGPSTTCGRYELYMGGRGTW
jgi:hypothetical protein